VKIGKSELKRTAKKIDNLQQTQKQFTFAEGHYSHNFMKDRVDGSKFKNKFLTGHSLML